MVLLWQLYVLCFKTLFTACLAEEISIDTTVQNRNAFFKCIAK